MATLKKIKLLSLAKLQAVIMGYLGLIAGILYSFGGAIHDSITTGFNEGTALAFMALVFMPILFGAFGFAIGIVQAILYNLISKIFGINIDLKL